MSNKTEANRYIAFCGIDCTQCPQYKQDCPDGCLGSFPAKACGTCAVRKCNLERKVVNCAYCREYPCQKLEEQYVNMANDGYGGWATYAKAVLDEIKRI